jgi:hypothetical protein
VTLFIDVFFLPRKCALDAASVHTDAKAFLDQCHEIVEAQSRPLLERLS